MGPFPKKQRWLLILRGLLGATNNMIKYYALQHLPLADIVMISATAPMFTVFFARIFIKELIYIIDMLNIGFIIGGMLLITQPPFLFGSNELISENMTAAYALIAVILSCIFLQANVYVILRLLKDIHWSIVDSAFGMIGFLLSLVVGQVYLDLLDRQLWSSWLN